MNPIAMVGLGRMGANMARRLARAGFAVHGHDAAAGARESLKGETGVQTHASLAGAVSALRAASAGRAGVVVWLMLPAGDITEATLTELQGLLLPGDVVVEGGNSNYLDSQRRAQAAAAAGLLYLDCGVSGGVWGLANGYCLSLGGEAQAVALVTPFLQALSPTPQTGWLHCGASGSGHFVKMIHNGIEYGMMQSLAEGFALLEGRKDLALPLAGIAELWRHSSVVRSWLLDLTAGALAEPGALQALAPHVSDSGEGRWTVDEAVRQGTPAPVIAASLMSRFDSQGRADTGNRLLALMRQAFGGHAVVKQDAAP
jgi:6-phosphogluconate dehydrogenase